MAVGIRVPNEDEYEPALRRAEGAFGSTLEDWYVEAGMKLMPRDRVLAGYDEGEPVALAAAWPFMLSIPGGELACGGVTWVAVLPSHRRQGVLRELMRRQLDDLRERGEPIAALWASESGIYGRFGYGMAAPVHRLDAEKARFAFRDDPGPAGAIRLVDEEEARKRIPPIYQRVRAGRAGMFDRGAARWEFRLADHNPGGMGPRLYAVHEDDAYAIYRIRSDWESGIAKGTVIVVEALGTTAVAEREIWRFLFSLDLTSSVSGAIIDPSAPLLHGVEDPRSLRLSINDGLWLRLIDVDAALRARSWSNGDSVVVEVRDDFCHWNAGRYRLGADAGRTKDAAELALDVSDLASVYLGGVDIHALAAVGRVAGDVARADALFREPRPPFCPEVF